MSAPDPDAVHTGPTPGPNWATGGPDRFKTVSERFKTVPKCPGSVPDRSESVSKAFQMPLLCRFRSISGIFCLKSDISGERVVVLT